MIRHLNRQLVLAASLRRFPESLARSVARLADEAHTDRPPYGCCGLLKMGVPATEREGTAARRARPLV